MIFISMLHSTVEKILSCLLLLFCIPGFSLSQGTGGVLKGQVLDQVSQQPLAGVTLQLQDINRIVVSDSSGWYQFFGCHLGRYTIVATHSGYRTLTVPEVLITAGKETRIDLFMEEDATTLSGLILKAAYPVKGAPNHPFAPAAARSFSLEEVTRYAGGRNDPAKLVSNFAGVGITDDARNDLVVRGHSPAALQWQLEGVPIPNPNHFATLGNTGGPLSGLNTNALKGADFFTGAFPAGIGNVVGGVLDLSLRPGNGDRHEHLLQLNLFSGLEAMWEGPLGKKGSGHSFLIGYRYSFAHLGQSLGLNLGTTAVPRYSDWVAHLAFGKTKWGSLQLFGMGGGSAIDFKGASLDSSDIFAFNNEDLYFRSDFNVVGAKHTLPLSDRSYLRTVVSWGKASFEEDLYRYYDSLPERRYEGDKKEKTYTLGLSTFVHLKQSTQFSMRAGMLAEVQGIHTAVLERQGRNSWSAIRNFKGSQWLLQPYVQGRYRLLANLTFTAGLHGVGHPYAGSNELQPRVSLNWTFKPGITFSGAYGRHSQNPALPLYYYRVEQPDGSYDASNRRLGLSKAHHFNLGGEWRPAIFWRFKVEGYYQRLFAIPVEQTASGFSALNGGADFEFPLKTGLINSGKGCNQGVEISAERFFASGWYGLTSVSLFSATYNGSDGVKRSATFNNKVISNILAGKEWLLGSRKMHTLTLDIKGAATGGRYYTPVDLAASRAEGKEVLDESHYNKERLPAYFRWDTRLGFRINGKHRVTQSFYIDLQNVTGRKNVYAYRYHPATKQVGTLYQSGFFLDLLYRIQF